MLVGVEFHGKPRVLRHIPSDDDTEATSIHQEYFHQKTMYHVPAQCQHKTKEEMPPPPAKAKTLQLKTNPCAKPKSHTVMIKHVMGIQNTERSVRV